jgi:transcriptional regulator with XRE-family HTH domain
MTANDRIRAIRQALGLTMEAFGNKLGVSRAAISNVENGNRGVTNQLSLAICREFHVNPAYLEGTSDEMFLVMTREEEIAAFMGDVLKDGPDSFRQRFIAMLAGLDPDDWKVLEKIVEQLKKD